MELFERHGAPVEEKIFANMSHAAEEIAVSTAAKENDTDRQISIAALTKILFGWAPYTEEKLPEVLQKDLNKIEPADGVFLNEIV